MLSIFLYSPALRWQNGSAGTAQPAVCSSGVSPERSLKEITFLRQGLSLWAGGPSQLGNFPPVFPEKEAKSDGESWRRSGGGRKSRDKHTQLSQALVADPQPRSDSGSSP